MRLPNFGAPTADLYIEEGTGTLLNIQLTIDKDEKNCELYVGEGTGTLFNVQVCRGGTKIW